MRFIQAWIFTFFLFLSFEQSAQSESISDHKIIFLDTKESLQEQLKQFNGKIVYLDIWATYCAPCINEFVYKKKLNSFFDKNEIVTLCICVDKAENKDKWEKIIKQNSVKGFHIFIDLGSVIKYKTYINSTGKESMYFGRRFPQFLIIGKNGEILQSNAAPPSNKDLLIKQINDDINKTL